MGDKTVSYCMFCPPPPPCSVWMILAAHFAFLFFSFFSFFKNPLGYMWCISDPSDSCNIKKKHWLKQYVFYHNLTDNVKSWNSYCCFFGNISLFFLPFAVFSLSHPSTWLILRVYPHCETIKQCIYQTFISRQTLQHTIAIFFIIHIIYISHSTDAANNGH